MPVTIRVIVSRCLAGLLVFLFLLPSPSFAIESKDTQLFITGFNAYQKKDYSAAVEKMSQVLKNYPDTQLRDMAIFWLARASFKAGDREVAAKYMAQFLREYPENPLKGTVEDELAELAAAYAKSQNAAGDVSKAEAEKLAAIKTSALKAEEEEKNKAFERAEAAKAAQAKLTREMVAVEKAAAAKARLEKNARDKAEAERLEKEVATAKLEKERLQAAKAASDKAQIEIIALEKAETKRLAILKSEQDRARLAAEKAESERASREAAEEERRKTEQLAREKSEKELIEKQKAESEKLAAEKVALEQKRLAAEQAESRKNAEAAAEVERLAAKRVEEERLARSRELEAKKLADAGKVAAEQKRSAKSRKNAARTSARRTPVKTEETARSKAIEDYRLVIDNAPGSTAAEAASAKLKALGVDYPPNGKAAKTRIAPQPPVTTQVLDLEVGQFVDVEFNLDTANQVFPVGRRVKMPFEVVNRGNGEDSFYLESGFPALYGVQFFSETNGDVPVNLTPQLTSGQKFKGVMAITIPKGVIDGQKVSFPVKLASKYARDVSQSRQVTLIASAPLLRAVISTDKKDIAPGEKVTYRVTLLNLGSAPASGVLLRMNYPPLYEPVDPIKSGFKQEMKAALLLDGLKLESGESRELSVTFQLKDEAIARQELFLRGDLINNELETSDSFVSAVSLVQGISGVTARSTSDRLLVIPGQTVTIPLIVANSGNQREDYPIRAGIPANVTYTFYQDLNRDGIRQSVDPVINHIGPLSPREEAYVILELKTSANESDGSSAPLSITFEPEGGPRKSAAVGIMLAYSRPLVELSMTGRGGRLRPGEVATFDLTCVNRGSSIAKVVEMRSILPDALELVASDPPVTLGKGGEQIWKFEELGAGEKKAARVSIRVKPGIAVGTGLQVKNLLSYQDQLGNSY